MASETLIMSTHSHQNRHSPDSPGQEPRSRRQVKAEERPDRKKRWTAKVKTGCATCRARRIKCDEGKPVCRRCVFSKRQCGGYVDQPPPQYSTTDSCCSSPASSVSIASQPSNGLGPIHHEASSLEQQMFYRFRTQTVFQAHLPLWHASVALAALTSSRNALGAGMSVFPDAAVDGLTSFVMKHYQAAIHGLIPLSNPSGDAPTFEDQQVLLMTNVLLLGLASMQGNQRDAAMFSRHSFSLFNYWRFWRRQDNWKTSSQGAMLSVAPLTALMYRLQSQETADRLQQPDWLLSDFDQFTKIPSATAFVSLSEAYRELQPILAGLTMVAKERQLRPYTDFMLPAPEACLAFCYAFTAWKAKYEHFRDSQPLGENSELEFMILDLLKGTVEHTLFLSDDHSPLVPMHHHMADTAERILVALTSTTTFSPYFGGSPVSESHEASSSSSQDAMAEWLTTPTANSPRLANSPRIVNALPYCFGPVVLEALFIIAIGCANFELRRRAISTLRRWPRAEAIWSSVIMAAFAEALMATTDAIDGGLEVLEEGLGQMQLRSVTDTRENWPGRMVLVSW